jgi:hypothetical protein
VSWSDSGGRNGTIVVTANDDQDFFINRHLGNPGKWTRLSSPMPAGYSRFTIPVDGPGCTHDPGLVFVITGAQYGKPGGVAAGIIPLGDGDRPHTPRPNRPAPGQDRHAFAARAAAYAIAHR